MRGFTAWWSARRRNGAPVEGVRTARRPDAEFATVFANAPIGITISDDRGTIVHANAAMERFLGYGPGELAGARVRSFTHPDDIGRDIEGFRSMHRGERESYQNEKRYVRKDGSIVWGRLMLSSVRGPDRAFLYAIGMIEDITQARETRLRLDASLKDLEDAHRRLKLYLDRAPLACVFWSDQQIVQAWNPAAEAMFGYSAEEAIGRNVYELTATPAGLAIVDRIRQQAQEGIDFPEGVIIENRRKDGSCLHCHWHFTIIDSGNERGVVAFAIDVSAKLKAERERELLEANLRQAQKMQSLGTLAGGIAHDFNNILLAISGNTRLAMEDLPSGHPALVSLQEVSKASTRASSVVNQILLFSRREESAYGPVNLRLIIEESLNLLRATLPARIVVRTRIDEASPIVLGDPAQIHQVLVNLATNAAHAMGESTGTLELGLTGVAVDEELALQTPELNVGQYHRIRVSDTGAGIDPQVIERIFEPFFTTKPRGQGTGLGLAVVHGIVKAHRGAIRVTSIPGEGSTFDVYLPALEKSAEQPRAASASAVRGLGKRVLYVDDEEALVYLITRVLERLDYRVAGFTDAAAAYTAFKAAPADYDAVVTDLSMPGMSGAELAREILKVRADVPVVMMSGYVRPEDRQLAREVGVRELLLKPNTVDELGDVLHRLLQGSEVTAR
jgi:PAS domain S-box-containing protein